MKVDSVGRYIYSEQDLMAAVIADPDRSLNGVLVDFNWRDDLDLGLNLNTATAIDMTPEEYDQAQQSRWYMPDEYQNFDIAQHVLSLCTCEAELQRVGQELLMYQERELFPLLNYLRYLVTVMRDNDIIYGIGRGSSVASFVLYLLGVHSVNSIEYDLDITEFLR